MARDFSRALYHSPAWLKNRKTYLNAPVDLAGHVLHVRYGDDGRETYCWTDEYGYSVDVSPDSIVPPGMCERCFSRGVFRPAKVVHHIEHVTPENVNDPHVTLSYDNFQRLCQDCHAAVHAGGEESRVTFDEFGNVVWKDIDG